MCEGRNQYNLQWFNEKYNLFALDNIKNHFINQDIANSQTASL